MNRLYRTRSERITGGAKRLVIAFTLFMLLLDDEGGSELDAVYRSLAIPGAWATYGTLLVMLAFYGCLVAGIIGIVRALFFSDEERLFAASRDVDVASSTATRVTLLLPASTVHHAAWIEWATFAVFCASIGFGIVALPVTKLPLALVYSLWPLQSFVCSTLLWTSRAELGSDGVYICRTKRFVAFTAADVVIPKRWGFEVWRDDELVVRLRLRVAQRFERSRAAETLAVAIGRLREGARTKTRVASIQERLADEERGTIGYRVASVTPDDRDMLHELLEASVDPSLAEAREKWAKKLILPR